MSADGAVEDIETFRVILEVPGEESGVVLGVDTAVVTIINNDSKQNFTRECVISLSISLSLSPILWFWWIFNPPPRGKKLIAIIILCGAV